MCSRRRTAPCTQAIRITPASSGTETLRQAVCEKFARENNLHYTPQQVLIGCGAKQLIQTAFAATLDEGDEVIVPAPHWVSYPDMVRPAGGVARCLPCPEENGFKLRPEQLGAAIGPRTKWLVINSPNNPTGAVYSDAELRGLAAVLARHPHVCLLTDEIYEHFVYNKAVANSPASLDAELAERTLTVNGVSKTYAMTGWRIGYAAGSLPLIAAITKHISQTTTCPSSIGQAAAAAALSGDQTFVTDTVALYRTRRDRMLEMLAGIEGLSCRKPAGAFYAFPSVAESIGRRTADGKKLTSDLDVAQYLLRQAGVACIAGESYGATPYVRLSFAASMDRIEQGCARIVDAFARLDG